MIGFMRTHRQRADLRALAMHTASTLTDKEKAALVLNWQYVQIAPTRLSIDDYFVLVERLVGERACFVRPTGGSS